MVYSSSIGHRSDNSLSLKMDKTLEEFLMPPPESAQSSLVLRNSTDSLREESCSSFDRTNNSSSVSSGWNSSCSCHSMPAVSHGARSAFVFHKQPILPPLLCTSSRTEMKMLKIKAVEREQRRKQKEKERLISRVEAILSGIEISPKKHKRPVMTKETMEREKANESEKEVALMVKDPDDVVGSDSGTCSSVNISSDRDKVDNVKTPNFNDVLTEISLDRKHDNQGHFHDNGSDGDDTSSCDRSIKGRCIKIQIENVEPVPEEKSSSSSEDDGISFHDNAYRSSLRNLLQKSLNLNQGVAATAAEKERTSSNSGSSSLSESEDITENTVISSKVLCVGKSIPDSESVFSKSPTKCDESEQSSEEEALVTTIVEAALSDAKNHILNETCDQTLIGRMSPSFDDAIEDKDARNDVITPKNYSSEDLSWGTPDDKEIGESNPTDAPNLLINEPHNHSTSTKVNFPLGISRELGDEATPNKCEDAFKESPILPSTEAVELTGTICYDSTIADSSVDGVSGACPVAVAATLVSTGDLTLLQPVTSNAVSDATSTASEDERFTNEEEVKENCDPTIETGSLHSLKRSLSFVLDRPSPALESAVVEAVTQHFQGCHEYEVKKNIESELAAAKKKKMLHAHVRRGSYTLDVPSPYLVQNKESATIGPCEDDNFSETTIDTCAQNDVKRKLDLPSDSEASAPASAEKRWSKTVVSKAELNVANLCRLLQDQHKQQMESMKKRHEEQLSTLQKEIVHSKDELALELDDATQCKEYYCPPCDTTISPSLASTEYKDIRIGGRHDEQQAIRYVQNAETCKDDIDLSRVTDVRVTSSLHEKLCKFSALCKGHLTRRLLCSHRVQDVLLVIRDTSRLLLSLRSEMNDSKGMDSVRDTYLEDRLYAQLSSALHEVQNIFFNISVKERMYIIAHSSVVEKKVQNVRKISAATQKSLERKQLLIAGDDGAVQSVTCITKVTKKYVKSKIAHIWKSEPTRHPEKKSLDASMKSFSKSVAESKKTSIVTSQRKAAKFSVTSHTAKSVAAKRSFPCQKSPSKPKSYLKSRNNNMAQSGTTTESVASQKSVVSQAAKSGSSKFSSASQKKGSSQETISSRGKKPIPLKNRANNIQTRY